MLPTNILVPVDFSAGSERALDYACGLAAKLGATVHLIAAVGAALPELNVVLTDSLYESLRQGNLKRLETLAAERAARVSFGELIAAPGDAREAILHAVETVHANLIVMGTHGRRGLSRIMIGSVAEYVVRHASCPVLTVREPKP